MTKTRQPPSHGQITDPAAERQLDGNSSFTPSSSNALSSPGPVPKTTSPPSHGQVKQSGGSCPFSNGNTTGSCPRTSDKGEAQLDGDPFVPRRKNAGGMHNVKAANTTSPSYGQANPKLSRGAGSSNALASPGPIPATRQPVSHGQVDSGASPVPATRPPVSHGQVTDPKAESQLDSAAKTQRPFTKTIPHLDLSIRDPLERVKAFVTFARDPAYYGHDKALLSQHLKPVSASKGHVEFELTVPPGMTNRMRNLHGGAAALLFDCATTAALVTVAREGGWWRYAGVTRSLSVQYYRPVGEGERVRVLCEVVQVGKRLAQIRGRIVGMGEKGTVRCEAEHLKVNIDPEVNSKL